ncbi:MAG: hypothetical protein Q8P49_00085 [Candidatus Liptonbacteria bacterium]|nr:hypothetical protein [Candidatus Liptonbacteria bacterium]
MTRTFYLTVAVLVTFAIVAWLFMFRNLIYQNSYINANMPSPVRHKVPVLGLNATPSPSLSEVPDDSPPLAVTISYTDAGFDLDTVIVKVGTTVTFKNKSSDSFWPAANPHPMHTEYPVSGGCRASTFDACKRIQPGSSWSFRFDVAGKWGFHDHLNPGEGGTITVQ